MWRSAAVASSKVYSEAGALHRLLLHAVDGRGLGYPGRFQDRRADVDAVRELAALAAAVLDPARPGDDHAVTRAAQVAGDLLAPREGAVAGPGPGRRVVRRGAVGAPGVQAAVLLDQRQLLGGGERDAVLHGELVERAGEGAFHAGAVVAPDVDDEGVVEFAHLLDRVQQAADVPVGVLLDSRRRPPSAGRRAPSRRPTASPRPGARPAAG